MNPPAEPTIDQLYQDMRIIGAISINNNAKLSRKSVENSMQIDTITCSTVNSSLKQLLALVTIVTCSNPNIQSCDNICECEELLVDLLPTNGEEATTYSIVVVQKGNDVFLLPLPTGSPEPICLFSCDPTKIENNTKQYGIYLSMKDLENKSFVVVTKRTKRV